MNFDTWIYIFKIENLQILLFDHLVSSFLENLESSKYFLHFFGYQNFMDFFLKLFQETRQNSKFQTSHN